MGMKHETNGPDEVMYPTIDSSALRRNLDKGDYDGMSSMYG